MVNVKRREEILGLEFHTNNSGRCFVIDYKNKSDVTIMFYDPICAVKCRLNNLKTGKVSNPMFPSVQGVGYFGLGKYSRKDRKVYKVWCSVLDRCYNKKSFVKLPTYQDVTVCDEWLNFQNFASWCESQKFFNTKDDKGNSYQLDKDILVKGNKGNTGSLSKLSKPVKATCIKTGEVFEYDGAKEAIRQSNGLFHSWGIRQSILGNYKQHQGYVWSFLEEVNNV